jgi:hypothetical protein
MSRENRIFLGFVMMICGAILFDVHLIVTGITIGFSGVALALMSYINP